jgi:signal transduction histidine kinase
MTPSPIRILLVEDSPSDAALLEESLGAETRAQFQFTLVESWAEATKRLRQCPFDLMLLDLSLPDIHGRETFIQARAQAPRLAIVVLTGVNDEALGLEAVRHGIQDYLLKGEADGRQTARAMRYAIERKRAEEALRQAEAALQQERDQLELHVRQRTAQLRDANRALQTEIARRERAQEAHQEIQRCLAEAQETERGRISRELHDRLGQDLTALKLELQVLRKQGPFPESVRERISRLERLTEGLMRDTHRLAWELRPTALDDLGLELALRRYSSEWSAATGVAVDFHSSGTEGSRLPLEFETVLYRVAQEALTNVTRHAKARRVSVLLERRADCVSLIVEDDGKGFDADALLHAPATKGKLGLLGMQERVKLVGGSLEIESTPGTGATVFVRLTVPRVAPSRTPPSAP